MARGTRVANHEETGGSGAQNKPQRPRGARQRKLSSPTADAHAGLPMLRTSERGALKKCEFLWDMSYNRRLKPLTEAPALRFGSLVHAALADYYIKGVKRGKLPAKAFKKHYDADMKKNAELFGMRLEEEERWVNAEELGIAMLENYVEQYGTDPEWEVLATEQPFRVLVYHPESYDPNHPPAAQATAKPWFWYTGIVDGIWKNRKTKELWIPDHKTTAGIHKKLDYLQLDDQAGAYWSFGVQWMVEQGILARNKQLNGMLYNFLRKALPDDRASIFDKGTRLYLNLDGTVSKRQPPPYFKRQPIFRDEYDRNQTRQRAMVDFARMEMLRNGALPMTKSPGQFTCPGCPVADACELHETGSDWEGFAKQTMQGWDPYEQHEIYDGR